MASISRVGCLLVLVLHSAVAQAQDSVETKLQVVRDGARDWLECYNTEEPTTCLETRTSKQIHELTSMLKKDVFQYFIESKRLGKMVNDDVNSYTSAEVSEMEKLETENQMIADKIKGKESKPNGLVDEISDLFTYGVAKLMGYFSPGKSSEEDLTEQIIQASDRGVVEGRGGKKKYLKKQNKHLKIILLMMLFKNKVKMFMHKFSVLLQLKFLGIAVLNLLINVIRLWLDLKKKKPHKVVYYENAHHQHHYDHEHIHDDGHSHPGSHSHYSHHEEDYGGGPWPWSRSYIEKQSEQAFQAINSQHKPNMAAHNVIYLKQRPVR